ncbi:MAG: hypothetical protein ACYCPP_04800 [Nitrososphaerales archaeon]
MKSDQIFNLSKARAMFDNIIAYKITDLLFGVRIEEICRNSSATYARAETADELIQILKGQKRSLLVCDLVSVRGDLASIKKITSENNCAVLGYYPHVDKETESLARSLGVEYVTPRSAFQMKLKSLLA